MTHTKRAIDCAGRQGISHAVLMVHEGDSSGGKRRQLGGRGESRRGGGWRVNSFV